MAESSFRLVTPTMKVLVPHPPPVIREAAATFVLRRRRSYIWPVVVTAICAASFAIGAFIGHVVKTDTSKRPVATVVARAARTNEVLNASVADGARPRAPIPPPAPVRVARRAPVKSAQADSDLELAFRAEIHR